MNNSAHLLVVDDDREIRDLLMQFLGEHGYRVTTARDGREVRQALADRRIDLIILDLMLPGEDGLTLCRHLRARSNIPIIMLTAMGGETDRIIGLEMGADDYLPKPFNSWELLARVKAVLRRAQDVRNRKHIAGATTVRFAGWKLDLVQRRLESPEDVVVQLSTGEFDLLVAFAEHSQRILSREQLLDLSRRREAVPFDRSIDNQVSRLRRKIEANPKEPEIIITVRGGGYIFTPEVQYG